MWARLNMEENGVINAFLTILLAGAASGVALAQQQSAKGRLVGAWELVSVASETDDGRKGEPFGPSPKGIIIFSADGHFSLFQSTGQIPLIAANDRAKATAAEAQAVVASSIAYFGRYSVDADDKGLTINLDASTFANVAALPDQRRLITLLTSTELKFDNPRTPSGVTLRTSWKRAPGP